MPGYVASLIPVSSSTIIGWVASMDSMQVAIICHREAGTWVPKYALTTHDDEDTNPQRVELPECFKLDPEASSALEQFYTSVQAELN